VRSTDCSCADNTTAGDGEGRCFVGAYLVQGKAGECLVASPKATASKAATFTW
jgi:hypothetical protein